MLNEQLKDQSYLIASQGEQEIRITKEDPISPVEVLQNNVRTKLKRAQDDVDRFNSRVADAQKKVSEKKALLGNHKQRYQQLQQKKTQLLSADGGTQKILSVIRAIMRFDKETLDTSRINEEASPTEVLKYISEQSAEYSKHEEKPEQISKIVKRLKKMVSVQSHVVVSTTSSCYLSLTNNPLANYLHIPAGKKRPRLPMLR